jgi:hypothetical protein
MRSLFFALALLGAVTACTTKKVLEIQNAPISSSADPAAVIEGALRERGWHVVSRSPGVIDASILLRDHRADIRITYDANRYSIAYRGSENLHAKNGLIHRNYNRWVANLNRDIQRGLLQGSAPAAAPAEAPTAPAVEQPTAPQGEAPNGS